MKASHNESVFGETVYSYSRRQAVEDGVLVDLTVLEITRQHWTIPLCCSDSVWTIIQDGVTNHGKDLIGILHDLYIVAKQGINAATGQDRIQFKATVGVAATFGPGDTAMPILPLMLPSDE